MNIQSKEIAVVRWAEMFRGDFLEDEWTRRSIMNSAVRSLTLDCSERQKQGSEDDLRANNADRGDSSAELANILWMQNKDG